MPGQTNEDIVALLRARGLRMTTARRAIVAALLDGSTHPTAESLAVQVQAMAPGVHLSTIYRNLEELDRLGIVVHAHLGHAPASYHLASAAHGHLVCEDCAATIDVPAGLFVELTREARRRFGFEVDPYHFAVPGRCTSCAAGGGGRQGTGRPGGGR